MKLGKRTQGVRVDKEALIAAEKYHKSSGIEERINPQTFACEHEGRERDHHSTPWGTKLMCWQCHIRILAYQYYYAPNALGSDTPADGGVKVPRTARGFAASGKGPRKSVGKSMGLGVLPTWAYAFKEHPEWTDKEIGDFMRSEFPAGGNYPALLSGARRRYNRGEFTGGAVPEKLSVPKETKK